MKKVIILTESDLTKIVKRVINEQKFQILSKLLSNSGDDLVKAYGDDVVKQLDDVFASALRNPRTTGINQLGKQFLKSASGTEVELETISRILNAVSKGANIDDLARYLPSKLADGTDFRTVLQSKLATSKKLPAGAVGAAVSSIPTWVSSKWFITSNYEPYIGKLFEKVYKLKNIKFNSKDIKVINKTNIGGREVLEIKLPTNDEILIYKSTGTGAPELKQAGDWQVIAGFVPKADNPKDVSWFVKNEATTQLSKGLNPYLTELDNFLKQNGPGMLGK
jgi:hypothetical protein